MKTKILLIIALLIALIEGARGQIYVDSYRFGVAAGLLLDDYPNAAAAYSLRLLRTAYTGNCMGVARANGDTSLIGFSSGYLDTVALKNFCGTASTDTCWVRTWYDQSGNAINATQLTKANQPILLLSGAIIYKAGLPAIDFDGTNDFLQSSAISNFITASAFTSFAVFNIDTIVGSSASTSANDILWGDHNAWVGVELKRNPNTINGWNYDTDYDVNTISLNLNIEYIFYHAHYGDTLYSAINNDSQTSRASGNTGDITLPLRIGSRFVTGTFKYYNGKFQEAIWYKTDQSANRTGINTNINTFYSIY